VKVLKAKEQAPANPILSNSITINTMKPKILTAKVTTEAATHQN